MSPRLPDIFFRLAGALLAVRRFFTSRRPVRPIVPGMEKHTSLKKSVLKYAVIGLLLAVAGFLVAASGIIPIKASSGHWPITAWFLNFSMQRSVSTHTIGMKVPPLDDPALVLKGAGHYESGCRPCHGSPAVPYPRVAAEMTPHPPNLPPVIPEWDPEELFYIVKHGVKFTGMPAWPALHRDDEVWAVVAFLQALPEMDAQQYRNLVFGGETRQTTVVPLEGLTQPENVPRTVTENCARCHGMDGLGRGAGAFPKLAGQHPDYLFASLLAFARGERHSGIMEPIAAGLDREQMQELAVFYGNLPAAPPPLPEAEVARIVAFGEEIARSGIPDQKVPSCASCHGPTSYTRNPMYPRLAGQYADYLVLQLELFQKEYRGGTDYKGIMDPVVHRLTTEEMQAVAAFYESLDPALDNRPVPDTTSSREPAVLE